jgi:hypothetical protein
MNYMPAPNSAWPPCSRAAVLCPSEVEFGGFRWRKSPKNPGLHSCFGLMCRDQDTNKNNKL